MTKKHPAGIPGCHTAEIRKHPAGIPGCHTAEIRKYRIAIYMRLSKQEDDSGETPCGYTTMPSGKSKESSSITTQRLMLQKYVSDHFTDYTLLEFFDDGYTGTNFDRPGIQELLGLIKDRAVDCVVVKDFSRFARDYITLGSYLEQIFPFMGIRFISVDDHYDSENMGGSLAAFDIKFRNLIYDLYSRDLSKKVKSALVARKAKGEYVSANCPFGYEKAPDDRHMLLIAEDEAAVVRRIFELTENGYTSTQVAKLFNREKVKTPIEFKIEKGRTTRNPKGRGFLWTTPVICRILTNPVYAGDVVYGKYEKDFVGGKNHLKPREEWKVFRNHHEPIIDRERFDRIQKDRGKKRTAQYRKTHPLVGKAVCGCCGRNLRYRSGMNPYFQCHGRYSNAIGEGEPGKSCVEKVNVMFLEQYVLFMAQEKLREDGELEKREQEQAEKAREKLSEASGKRKGLLAEYERLKQEHFAGYQRYASGETETFWSRQDEMKAVEKEISALEGEIEKLEETYGKIKYGSNMAAHTRDAMMPYGDVKQAAECLINRIVVYSEQDIEIEWTDSC